MDEISKLDFFLSEVQKQGKSEAMGVVHTVSVRFPTHVLSTIDALARASGMSRNKVIVQLVDVGVDEMWRGVDPEFRDIVASLQVRVAGELLGAEKFENAVEGEI